MKSLGWIIVCKYYYGGGGEIDIIGMRKGELCFVEVKARKESNFAVESIFMSMSSRKQKRMISCSQHFLEHHDKELQFEVCYFVLCGYIGDVFYWMENPFDE